MARRTNLVAARIAAGFDSQEAFVQALIKDKVKIKLETYRNIESGRNKTVDVIIAFAICAKLNKTVEEIFLGNAVQKIHRKNLNTATDQGPAA